MILKTNKDKTKTHRPQLMDCISKLTISKGCKPWILDTLNKYANASKVAVKIEK